MAQGFTGANALLSGSGAVNRVAFWSSANVLSSNAGFTFVSGTQTLTVTNLVVSTAATFSFGTATRIPYYGASGGLTDAASLTFDGNLLTLASTSVANGLVIGGVEIYRPFVGTLLVLGGWNISGSTLVTGNVGSGGVFQSQVDGSGGGYYAGVSSDVQWYRNAADVWRTPDSVTIDANLIVTTAATFSARTATRVAFFGAAGLLTDSANLTFNGTALTVGASVITGTSGNLTIGVTAAKTLTLASADNYTLTVPATGTAALLATANVFTATQTISAAAPSLVFTDTTAAAKSLTIAVDANVADFRESAGASGSLLVLDLANGHVFVGTTAAIGAAGATIFSVYDDSGTNTLGEIEAASNNSTNTGVCARYSFSSNASSVKRLALIDCQIDTSNASYGGVLRFGTKAAGAALAVTMFLTGAGNLGIGGSPSFGTGAVNNLRMPGPGASSTAPPTSSITDYFHLFGADAAAGKAWPSFREEGNTTLTQFVMGVNATQGVSTGTGTVKMNGATSRNSVGWLTTNDHTGAVVYVPYWTTVTG
jgi:hypothetical protein